ncbi:MAG TPA: SAM-dependent methyltransferase [Bryobacteraceae bacterium]|nr:SAM-dependent methyltransferase [Bryobacteraceae bacterium]
MHPEIEDVSDTALMVAGYRAIETARPDALIRDPWAARLAGDRGMAIARSVPGVEWAAIGISMRFEMVDELLLHALERTGARTVVNLGAGLDTRPWRLNLPPGLRWIEADFPAMLKYKAERLADHAPRCRLDRIAADLTNPLERRRVFAAVDVPAVMITEGLLMYLSAEVVDALAKESAEFGISAWVLDAISADMMHASHRNSPHWLDNVRAQDHLTGKQILDWVRDRGWTDVESRSYLRDASAPMTARIMGMLQAGGANATGRPPEDDPSGVYCFGR